MSPTARLICYPPGDANFGRHAASQVKIAIPETADADEVVREIQRRLRETYPLAEIRVDVADGDGAVWHVYRDGVDGHDPVNGGTR